MEIFMGRRRDIDKGFWMSFENHPRLEKTKEIVYKRCVPCLEKLVGQLLQSPNVLSLDEPLDCWKVIVVLNELDECFELLELFQDELSFAPEVVRGRVGSNNKNSPKTVVIFQMNDREEKERIMADVTKMVQKITSQYSIYDERGCQDIYGVLCGDWRKWDKITPIKNRESIPAMSARIDKLLRGDFAPDAEEAKT
ncbi:MAG: hypothetical protein ACOX6X_04535 [Dethiobacteria bacterium]